MDDVKERIIGRIRAGNYEIVHPGDVVVKAIPLVEAKEDSKLLAAIKRNGWEAL